MRQYQDLLRFVLDKGKFKADRTGTGTLSVFGTQIRYDLRNEQFPLITTKKIPFKSAAHELLWFLSGDTNTEYLHKHGIKMWDPWADKDGNLGRIYGALWNDWRTPDGRSINQIDGVIDQIKTNPDSRRLIVSAWDPADNTKIPSCCSMFQFFVQDGELSSQLYQRSGDLFLGVPYNIAVYSLLTKAVAQVTGLKPAEFIHTFGDLHLYSNHIEQAKLQASRDPRSMPRLKLNPERKNIRDFVFEDFELIGYDPHPGIKAQVAV